MARLPPLSMRTSTFTQDAAPGMPSVTSVLRITVVEASVDAVRPRLAIPVALDGRGAARGLQVVVAEVDDVIVGLDGELHLVGLVVVVLHRYFLESDGLGVRRGLGLPAVAVILVAAEPETARADDRQPARRK